MKFPRNSIILPRLHSQFEGGEFMGLVAACPAFPHDHLVIDVMEAPDDLNWDHGMEWAQDHKLFLPTRREQSVMFGNRREGQYQKRWYWSCEPYAGDERCAWLQHFSLGLQNGFSRGVTGRASAVRRVLIGE